MKVPESFTKLLDALKLLPGIGEKSAERIAFYLLNNREIGTEILDSLKEALSSLKECSICGNITDRDICEICSSTERDRTKICIVVTPMDIYAIEKTGVYNGLYHVLGGLISPLDGKGPEDIRLSPLFERLEGIEEVILAIKPTTEGDATSMFIADALKKKSVKVSKLASGIPVGGELEFTDPLTIINAIRNRSEI